MVSCLASRAVEALAADCRGSMGISAQIGAAAPEELHLANQTLVFRPSGRFSVARLYTSALLLQNGIAKQSAIPSGRCCQHGCSLARITIMIVLASLALLATPALT